MSEWMHFWILRLFKTEANSVKFQKHFHYHTSISRYTARVLRTKKRSLLLKSACINILIIRITLKYHLQWKKKKILKHCAACVLYIINICACLKHRDDEILFYFLSIFLRFLFDFFFFYRFKMHSLEPSAVYTAGVLGCFDSRTTPLSVEGLELIPDGR